MKRTNEEIAQDIFDTYKEFIYADDFMMLDAQNVAELIFDKCSDAVWKSFLDKVTKQRDEMRSFEHPHGPELEGIAHFREVLRKYINGGKQDVIDNQKTE